MPGMTQHPSSDQLQLVIDLTAGMGLKAPQRDDDGKSGPRLRVWLVDFMSTVNS